jgi:YHS domain-containing protein
MKLPSAMDETRQALVNKKTTVVVNYEIFFFADKEERQQFEENIVEYCGLLTDPVAKKRFRPNQTSPRYDYQERAYFFLSQTNRAEFEANPEVYARPKFAMMSPKM